MANWKVWVKRAGASATQVALGPDDLVDDVRDAVIRKYLNSLGRTFDAPDVSLKIRSREHANKASTERSLAPDEQVLHLINTFYPGGQTLDEALIIDVPRRRTPRASPRLGSQLQSYFLPEESQPAEPDNYFPPMPNLKSPSLDAHGTQGPNHLGNNLAHSMAVLTTGQLPAVPSPGGRSNRNRPKTSRQHNSSPTVLYPGQTKGNLIEQSQVSHNVATPAAPPLSTPPGQHPGSSIPSVASPRPAASSQPNQRPKQGRRRGALGRIGRINDSRHDTASEHAPPTGASSAGPEKATVPPINVLIVEDNVINLKLLEAFMKRLKVRWKTAMDGKEAVAAWRTGGFHLVLMDIQLPVMNGLDATKEIRRLEAVNRIGVLSGNPLESLRGTGSNCNGDDDNVENEDVRSEDRLASREALFKSPVIIVALTASSLQSDRHEALAAGCNDFLTKPVNFVWMERKVTEWGCMQALIDFDGWRKWKDLAAKEAANKESKKGEGKVDQKAALKAMFSQPPKTRKEREIEQERARERELKGKANPALQVDETPGSSSSKGNAAALNDGGGKEVTTTTDTDNSGSTTRGVTTTRLQSPSRPPQHHSTTIDHIDHIDQNTITNSTEMPNGYYKDKSDSGTSVSTVIRDA